MIYFTGKKHEAYLSLWADYTWIQRQAKVLDKSEEDTVINDGTGGGLRRPSKIF